MDYKQLLSDDTSRDHPEATFRKKVEQITAKYTEQHKPFCERCAKLDWRNTARDSTVTIANQELAQGFVDFELEGIIPKNMEKYGDSKRFVWIKDSKEVFTRKNNPGVKEIAIFRTYLCTERGCGITLELTEEQATLKDEIYDWTQNNKKEAYGKRMAVDKKNTESLFNEKKISKEQLKAFYKKTELF